MSDRLCPRCAGPLTTGPAIDQETDPSTGTTPPTSGGTASAGLPLTCAACGWTSAADLPGSLGGDNGGAWGLPALPHAGSPDDARSARQVFQCQCR